MTEKVDSSDARVISKDSVLVAYGQAVFEREGCGVCHSKNIGDTTYNLISLDGYGQRRSNTFTYSLIVNPQSVLGRSVMPSYHFLQDEMLNKRMLFKIIEDYPEYKNQSFDSLWMQLNTQASALKDSLEFSTEKSIENNEVIALVAYLQQIPTSEEMKKLDSIKNEKINQMMRAYDELYEDFDVVMAKTKSNEENIATGQSLFELNCAVCHGDEGKGRIGPDLTDQKSIYGSNSSDLAKTIVQGTDQGMPSHKYKFSPLEVAQVVIYLKSLHD